MDAYFHSWVLGQRLSGFCKGSVEYLEVDVDDHPEKLVLQAKANSEFMAAADEDQFLRWEQSSYREFDPKHVLKQVKDKITKLKFLGRSYEGMADFCRFLDNSDIDKAEGVYRTTVHIPRSVGVALQVTAEAQGKTLRAVMIDALRAYL